MDTKRITIMQDMRMAETIDGYSRCFFGNASNRSAFPGPLELSRTEVALFNST